MGGGLAIGLTLLRVILLVFFPNEESIPSGECLVDVD